MSRPIPRLPPVTSTILLSKRNRRSANFLSLPSALGFVDNEITIDEAERQATSNMRSEMEEALRISATRVGEERMETIPGVAREAAARFGDRLAVVDGDRSRSEEHTSEL